MQCRRNNQTIERVKKLIEQEIEVTYQDIADKCHIHMRNAREYAKILHEDRFVHIYGYLPYNIPIFKLGKGSDAKKKSRNERGCASTMAYRLRRDLSAVYQSANKASSMISFLMNI